jgi:hypothetical protein
MIDFLQDDFVCNWSGNLIPEAYANSLVSCAVGAQGVDKLFTWNEQPEIYVTLKSSTSVTSSLLILFGDANLQFHNTKRLECSLKRVNAARVNKEELTEFMRDEKWKPDIDKKILKWPQPNCFGRRQVSQLPDKNSKISFAFHHFEGIEPWTGLTWSHIFVVLPLLCSIDFEGVEKVPRLAP